MLLLHSQSQGCHHYNYLLFWPDTIDRNWNQRKFCSRPICFIMKSFSAWTMMVWMQPYRCCLLECQLPSEQLVEHIQGEICPVVASWAWTFIFCWYIYIYIWFRFCIALFLLTMCKIWVILFLCIIYYLNGFMVPKSTWHIIESMNVWWTSWCFLVWYQSFS